MLCIVVESHSDWYSFLFTSYYLPMKALYTGLTADKQFMQFTVGADKKIYLPKECYELSEKEVRNRLQDACAWFTSSYITLC